MGAADEDDSKHSQSPGGGNEEKIFVSVRLRPLNDKEIFRNDVVDWECINDTTIIYKNNLSVSERSMYPSAYTFDRVFRSDAPTRQVYEEAAKEVALSVVNGINASVFAYGQTSSGKTFTMSGITEYTMADIFDYTEKHKEREFIMKFSAMEIYNESVRDLLSADSTPLRLLDDPERGTVVEKLTEETLRNRSHLEELLSICEAQRQIGETALNEASSRSHQILRLAIESAARDFSGKDKSSILIATVNFVDLAGSERASQSLSAGTRLKEGCHINRSLLTLGTVIRKLSKGKNGHVPYRDSKLTRILQSSLGGNARTAIICTMSPARTHVEQSRNTLLFASCAKEVTTNAQVNVVMSDKVLVKHLQKELARLESELKSPKSSFQFEASALLQEKDLEIEKLRRQVSELTTERDLARSQVEDLKQVVEAKPLPVQKPEIHGNQYPKLRVQRASWDFEAVMESPILGNVRYPSVGIRSCETSETSDSHHSRSSSDENLPQLPIFKQDFPLILPSPQLPVAVHYVESDEDDEESEDVDDDEEQIEDMDNEEIDEEQIEDVDQVEVEKLIAHVDQEQAEKQIEDLDTEKVEELIDETVDDQCKEVTCTEIEEVERFPDPSPTRPSTVSCPELDSVTSALAVIENEDGSQQQFESTPLKDHKLSRLIDEDFIIPSPEKSSLSLLGEDISSLKLFRSRSCRACLMNNSSPDWLDKKVVKESTPASEFERFISERPKEVQRKVSALKFDMDIERLPRDESQTSPRDAHIDEPEAAETEDDTAKDNISNISKTDVQTEQQLTDTKDAESKRIPSIKSVKSVGLDPIDIQSESPTHWQVEFKRLQREIFELWHACNVSLVHRTYFFQLFKGDPKDTVYLEVEHKRLLFLKDALLQGNQTVESGLPLTSATSMRALQQEKRMLSHLMKKKLFKEERENLFLRWGIGLKKKNRRLKLVRRLWTKLDDKDHITESAAVVSKLIGFVEPEQNFQEVFGFNFTAQRKSNRFGRWMRSVTSLV